MIVCGVDPGSRSTGVAVIDEGARRDSGYLASTTVHRPEDGSELLEPPRDYLDDVAATILAGIRDHSGDLLAVEGIRRPSWHMDGKAKPTDPSGIIATAIVFGAVFGRPWPVPIVVVPPGGNGRQPLAFYPGRLIPPGKTLAQIATMKGKDKLRHERAAFDVAHRARAARTLARLHGGVYA